MKQSEKKFPLKQVDHLFYIPDKLADDIKEILQRGGNIHRAIAEIQTIIAQERQQAYEEGKKAGMVEVLGMLREKMHDQKHGNWIKIWKTDFEQLVAQLTSEQE